MPSQKRRRTQTQPTASLLGTQSQSRARRKNAMVKVPRDRLAFPQSMKTKLRYVERIEMKPTNTQVVTVNFRANGLYDPNYTGVGHQPRGFDEFMGIYKTFTVLGSSISASFMFEAYDGPSTQNATGALLQAVNVPSNQYTEIPALSPCVCLLHKGTEILTSGSAEQQMEKDRTQWTYINGQTPHRTLKNKLKTQDFFGKAAIVGAEGYTGSDSTDPTETIFWAVSVGRASDDYPSDTTKVVAYVTLEYDAVFTEPKVMPQS